MSETPTSLYVAIYGAVVATAVAGWNIYQEVMTYRDRLEVQVTRANVAQGGVVIAKDRLWFKVTNVGRQPVWLHSVGGRNKRGSTHSHFLIVTAQSLPVKLEPGEAFHDSSSDATNLELRKVRYLCAWDSKGNPQGTEAAASRGIEGFRRVEPEGAVSRGRPIPSGDCRASRQPSGRASLLHLLLDHIRPQK